MSGARKGFPDELVFVHQASGSRAWDEGGVSCPGHTPRAHGEWVVEGPRGRHGVRMYGMGAAGQYELEAEHTVNREGKRRAVL